MDITVPYERTGRVNQKARTREALIAATRELLAKGVVPTMEGAAIAAAISPTTAYRYFPSLRELIVAAYPHVEQRSLLGPKPPEDPEARLAIVAENHAQRILQNELEMRAVLRLSLEGVRPPELPMHQGLRIAWIEDALAPLRGQMPEDRLRQLIHGIGATLGIEAFVWLTDIAKLPRDEAAATIRSNALGLLQAAIAEDNGPSKRTRSGAGRPSASETARSDRAGWTELLLPAQSSGPNGAGTCTEPAVERDVPPAISRGSRSHLPQLSSPGVQGPAARRTAAAESGRRRARSARARASRSRRVCSETASGTQPRRPCSGAVRCAGPKA